MSALSSTRSISYRELVAFRQSHLDAFSFLSLSLSQVQSPPLRLSQIPSSFRRPILCFLCSSPHPKFLIPSLISPNVCTANTGTRPSPSSTSPIVLSFALPSSPFPYFSIYEGTLCCVNGMGSLVRSLDGGILRTEQYALIFEI